MALGGVSRIPMNMVMSRRHVWRHGLDQVFGVQIVTVHDGSIGRNDIFTYMDSVDFNGKCR